jgi:hypothetical protein
MNVQQSDVMASVQRLRAQAQEAGQLQTTSQQVVSNEGSTIIIAPAQPNVVYVPVYNPTVVYGAWPYPAYPPVYYPPPGYVAGSALVAGLAFGTGVAISASLWGWARPNWGGGYVNVNVNHYNNINVNRAQIHNNNWQANRQVNRPNGGGMRPPAGPVGKPSRQNGLPAHSIGRPSVSVPGNITKPPAGMGPGNRPNAPGKPSGGGKPQFGTGNKPQFGGGNIPQGGGGNGPLAGAGNKPQAGSNRPHAGTGSKPNFNPPSGNRGGGPGAFNGMGDGRSAAQYGNRGAQSQHMRGGGGGGGMARGGGIARSGGRHR